MNGLAKRIGIIAGSGSLPIEVAQSVVEHGGSVHVVMVEGADRALETFPHTIVNWAQLGRATSALKRAGVSDVIVLGAGARPTFRNARPDFAFVRALPAILRLLKAGGDDAVLRGLLALFEQQGLNVVGVGDVAGELLVAEGCLTKQGPSLEDAADIATGFALIARLGRFDIGQGAIVSNGRIEAIEGAEGTDGMLKRVADARRKAEVRKHQGVLVKRPKPGQDLRVDLPAIGPNTVKNADAAGLAGIAVMAGHVLAAERSAMIEIADARGLFVVGIKDEQGTGRPTTVAAGPDGVAGLGSARVSPSAVTDISRAIGILSALADFHTGSAIVIDERRVIAIGAQEPPGDVIGRAGGLRGRRRRRRGVVAIGRTHRLDEAVLIAARDANLAGVVAADRSLEDRQDIIQLADKLGLFIAKVEIAGGGEGGGKRG